MICENIFINIKFYCDCVAKGKGREIEGKHNYGNNFSSAFCYLLLLLLLLHNHLVMNHPQTISFYLLHYYSPLFVFRLSFAVSIIYIKFLSVVLFVIRESYVQGTVLPKNKQFYFSNKFYFVNFQRFFKL